MSIIHAVALSLLLIVINLNHVNACRGLGISTNNRLGKNPIPDEVQHLFLTYEEGVDDKLVRERLHALALFLKGNRDFEGLIVSYAGQRACPGEAVKRAKIAKKFLTSQERLLSKQVKTIDAGYRKKWIIELWYGPLRAKTYPPAMDTIDRREVKIVRKCHHDFSPEKPLSSFVGLIFHRE